MPTHHRATRSTTRLPTIYEHHPSFLFVITNYPNFLQRTQASQRPDQHWQEQNQGAMLIPGVRVHLGAIHTTDQEQLLYNTLRYQLQQIIRAYLYQSYTTYPIYLVFDLSNIDDPFL